MDFIYFRFILQDSKGVTEVMSLLDKFAMELATDLEKKGFSNSDNATVDIKMDNIGKYETLWLGDSMLENVNMRNASFPTNN